MQLVAIDVNDLIELSIFGMATHERMPLEVVHLWPADRHDVIVPLASSVAFVPEAVFSSVDRVNGVVSPVRP